MKVLQQMWYPGEDGIPIAKGTLTICKERDLKGIDKMRFSELRALLASQPDFASMKPEIQEEAEHRGHILMLGPKCHPECGNVLGIYQTILQTALRTQHHYSANYPSTCLVRTPPNSEATYCFSQQAWKWIDAYILSAENVNKYLFTTYILHALSYYQIKHLFL